MLLLIPLLPFAGFVANAAFGRRLSKRASGALACSTILLSFAVAVAAVLRLLALAPESRLIQERVFSWIASGAFRADFSLALDPLSAVMILVVTGIGSLIHVYSTAYMHEEPAPEYARYFSYLNLFAAFMLVLVLGSNFLVMFVGWEGVGLCSYLLIGFWFQKKSASDAGKKAFIVNRIGDFAFVLGVLLLWVEFGTLEFRSLAESVSGYAPEETFGTLSLITLLLFIGATGKSAQIPLYVWLPDAMEGPTPVSALIHAATMVTAGVYMIGRNAMLFSHAPETLAIVAVIGAATALIAGSIGLVQNDIKRVLAYSTVSQLGYMFLAMGVGAYAAGIFHLYTHAFFKALLFLGSGAVIHALAGEQDLRRMGGLKAQLPITYWTFLIGALAIAGVPGLAGFFSKDEILFRTFAGGHQLLWLVGILTSLLTATYMFRLVFLAFHGPSPATVSHEHAAPSTVAASSQHPAPGTQHDPAPNAVHLAPEAPSTPAPSTPAPGTPAPGTPAPGTQHPSHLHDAPPAMAIALIVLAAGSIVAGYIGLPHALGGSNRLEQFLAPSLSVGDAEGEHAADEALELSLMAVSTVVAVTGIAMALFFFLRHRSAADRLAVRFAGVHRVLTHKYYVDEIYDAAVVQPIRIISEEALWKRIDARVIDGAVNGIAEIVGGMGELLRRLQTGSVRAYAASVFVGVVCILGYYLWR